MQTVRQWYAKMLPQHKVNDIVVYQPYSLPGRVRLLAQIRKVLLGASDDTTTWYIIELFNDPTISLTKPHSVLTTATADQIEEFIFRKITNNWNKILDLE